MTRPRSPFSTQPSPFDREDGFIPGLCGPFTPKGGGPSVTEHRDSPGIEPEEEETVRSKSRRRFARLVESPGSRRVALPRLILAVGGLFGCLALLIFAG